MTAPNVVSVAVIVGVIALAQGLSEQLPALGEPWVPFAVVALGALVKGLQVILQDERAQQQGAMVVGASSKALLRRWLVE
jgi:hypothetical protein